jgi:hypothetical protein
VAGWDKRPAVAQRAKKVTVRATGWTTAGQTLYIHYLRGSKLVRTEKVGALSGACGDLTKRIKAFAFKKAKPGVYGVRFSASPTWDPDSRWTGYRAVRLR